MVTAETTLKKAITAVIWEAVIVELTELSKNNTLFFEDENVVFTKFES